MSESKPAATDPHDGGPRQRPAPLGWGVLVAFGVPALAYSFYLFFVGVYFLNFATDVLLLNAGVMGVIFGLGRLWDAVSDPLVGYWSDRTQTGLGRRRPWLLAGIPALVVFSLMVWHPPAALEGGALVAWCTAALFGFYTAYTIYSVPHQSLGAELSLDHHERSRIFGVQRIAFVLGILLAFAALDRVSNSADPRSAAGVAALIAAGVCSVVLLASPLRLRERPDYQGRGSRSPYAALRGVVGNPQARVLLFACFWDGLGTGVLGVLAVFLTKYSLQRPDLVAVVPAFFVISSVIAIPLWVMASRRFGKREVWLAALLLMGSFFGATFFVPPGQIALICALIAGAGMANGCGGAIGPSMLADVMDADELSSGERKEGAYFAAWGLALKAGLAFAVALSGVALDLAGFVPNVEQTRTAELTLRGVFAGGPLLGSLVAMFCLRRFSLDEAAHARIRAELDARPPR